MVRPMDQEMTAIEMTVCPSQFSRGGDLSCHVGHIEKCQGWLGGRGSLGKMGKSLYCGFCGKEWPGKVNRLGIG